MITGISLVTVSVHDLDAATAFWGDTLGFDVTRALHDGERVAEAGVRGSETSLLLSEESYARPHHTGLVLTCDDMHATYDHMRMRGVEFTMDPAKDPVGVWSAEFADPDGNRFVLRQETAEETAVRETAEEIEATLDPVFADRGPKDPGES